jgi:hypothetical protein
MVNSNQVSVILKFLSRYSLVRATLLPFATELCIFCGVRPGILSFTSPAVIACVCMGFEYADVLWLSGEDINVAEMDF